MKETLSIKVSARKKALLKALAKERGTSLTRLMESALDYVVENATPATAPSCYDRVHHLFENEDALDQSGHPDLSTHRRHLKGYGADPAKGHETPAR